MAFALDAAVARETPLSPEAAGAVPEVAKGLLLVAIREGRAFAFSLSLRVVERVTRTARRVYGLVSETNGKKRACWTHG
jgi:hypothetical protein